jgi:linoleoyl-CoA desaturase
MMAFLDKCQVIGKFAEPQTHATTDEKFFKTLRNRVAAVLKGNGRTWRGEVVFAVVEIVVIMSLYCLFLYMRNKTGDFVWAILCGITVSRIGFMQHCGNHASFSPNKWLNKICGHTMDAIGGSSFIWLFDHGIAHHVSPNELGHDNDCEIANPLLRFHPKLPRKWWHKNQHLWTISLMTGGLLNWYVLDLKAFAAGAVGAIKLYPQNIDLLIVAVFKSLWFYLNIWTLFHNHGPARAVALLLVCYGIASHLIENIFIVNHIQPGLVHGPFEHWARKQVISSCNWASGSVFWNFMSGGLNHQIEHHLFPSMNIYNYPLISPVVKNTCKEFGLSYISFPTFADAHKSMRNYLWIMGEQDEVPESMFLPNLFKAETHKSH